MVKRISVTTMSEDKLQSKCFLWFHNEYAPPLGLRGLLWAIPNGGQRSIKEASKFRATGTTAGAPDMIFLYKGKATFLELKKEMGYLSQRQKIIHEKLVEHGFDVHIIRSFEMFKTTIKNIVDEQHSKT